MAIVVEFNAPGMTAAQYDSILSELDSKGVGSPMVACITWPPQALTGGSS